MNLGTVNIYTWLILFFITILYEILFIKYIIAISKLQPLLTANLNLMLSVVSMACVIKYTNQVNNCIPILAATWVSTFLIVYLERKKRAREDSIKNNLE